MANRRMFAKSIIDTDYFLEMPATSQLLYFHLSIRADDDGFVASPKRILRMVGSSEDDFKMLIAKQFVIPFDSGVCVIKHWRIHNLIRADRYQGTIYTQEKSMLTESENKSYELVHQNVIPDVIPTVNPVKVRLGKDSIGKGSVQMYDKSTPEIEKDIRAKIPKRNYFTPPTYEEVASYCEERKNTVDAQRFIDFYSSKGWMVGKSKMKDWKASVRTWERNEKPNTPSQTDFMKGIKEV